MRPHFGSGKREPVSLRGWHYPCRWSFAALHDCSGALVKRKEFRMRMGILFLGLATIAFPSCGTELDVDAALGTPDGENPEVASTTSAATATWKNPSKSGWRCNENDLLGCAKLGKKVCNRASDKGTFNTGWCKTGCEWYFKKDRCNNALFSSGRYSGKRACNYTGDRCDTGS